MFGMFSKRPTSKADVIFALASAVVAVWKAYDTSKQFKADQAALNQKEKNQ